MVETVGDSWVFDWNKDGAYYSISTEGTKTTSASLGFERSSPLAEQVLKCLGTPTRYWAFYNRDTPGNALHVALLFSNEGILATGGRFVDFGTQQPPQPDSNVPIGTFRYVQPGSADEVLRRLSNPKLVDVNKLIRDDYKPWPGKWEDLIVDIDPSLRSK